MANLTEMKLKARVLLENYTHYVKLYSRDTEAKLAVDAILRVYSSLMLDYPAKAKLMERLFGVGKYKSAQSRSELMEEFHISTTTFFDWISEIEILVYIELIKGDEYGQ